MRRVIALSAAVVLVLVLLAPAASAGGNGKNFTAHLNGGNEVPAVDTNAQGQALFKLHKGELRYKLIVANLEEVLFAHIHCAPAGQNGGVVVTLYPGPTTDGRTNGVLAEGTIEDADVTAGCMGEDATVDGLLNAIATGNTYVNVHTTSNPPGEVRGQIE